MNKRIKKKNDVERLNEQIFKVTLELSRKFVEIYARFVGYDREINDYFWERYEEDYDKWTKSCKGKRCWTYILKKTNIPKYIGYKNKTIKT